MGKVAFIERSVIADDAIDYVAPTLPAGRAPGRATRGPLKRPLDKEGKINPGEDLGNFFAHARYNYIGYLGRVIPVDDNQLIQQTLNGNRHAFRFLVLRYQKPVFKAVSMLIRERERVEDIAQETFLRAYKSLDTFDPNRGASFSTWLFTIARNRCFNEIKKDKVLRATGDALDPSESTTRDNTEGEIYRAERESMLREAISKLPQQFRTAVVLAYLEGHSMREIATIEGCSEGTVKSRIHRGKQLLKGLLAPLTGV